MLEDVKAQPDMSLDPYPQLVASPFTFFQAGSFFFECARDDSDWDWYTQWSPEVQTFLLSLGFSRIATRCRMEIDYPDTSYTIGVLQRGNVQVQMLKDVERMRRTRNLLFTTLAEVHLVADQATRDIMWRGAYDLCYAGSDVMDLRDLLNAVPVMLPAKTTAG